MRISIVLILCFFFHFTALMAGEMATNPLASFKGESTACIDKTNVFSKKQYQEIDFEAFSTHVCHIHQIEQRNHCSATINYHIINGDAAPSLSKTAPLKILKPYIYSSKLQHLYPKHTFW